MSNYGGGSVKRNPATGEIALRTVFPTNKGEGLANMAWLISEQRRGIRNAPESEVASWDDLYFVAPEGG